VLFEERDLTIMVTGIRRCLNVTSLVAVIALLVMSGGGGGAYAAKGPSSSGKTVLSGSGGAGTGAGGLTVSFPGALTATPAFVPPSLALTRVYQSSFGSFPASGDPQALTVDQSTGDVYAVSPGAGTVGRFTSAGVPDNFTAGSDNGTNTLTGFSFDGPSAAEVAIAPAGAAGGTAGDIYVVGFAGVDIYANDGTHLGSIDGSGNTNPDTGGEPCGVATDSAGKLYVGYFSGHVDRYTPAANPVVNGDFGAELSGVTSPCSLAADSTGAVYASTWSTGPLTKYTASDFGTSNAGTTVDASSRAVSVDPSTDDVYVDEGNKISVFDSAGTSLYTFGSASDFGSESAGVAVKGSGNSYVADSSSHEIDVYGPPVVVPPTAITGSASDIHHVKATLNGHLDPNGGAEITDCHFDWGTTNTYGNTAPCAQGNDYTQPADVSATITGLEPGKTYHYRLDVSAGTSTGTGTDQTLETVPVPVVHVLTSTFGASGSGDGQFSGNTGLAIDQTSGDVYVADTANHRIEKFGPSGSFISTFGWGVKDSKPEAQTCTTGCQAGIAGSGAGQLATPKFVAVDNSSGPSAGDVYVGDTTNNTVTKFDSSGNYISTNDGSSSGTPLGSLAGIAIDPSGDLWAYDTNADMRKFAQDGIFTTKWNSGLGVTPAGIAIDPSEHPYVVRENPLVEKLAPSGGDVGQISGPEFTGPTTGVAVNQTTGDILIDDGGKTIRLYSGTCDPSVGRCANVDSFGTGDLNAAGAIAINGSNGRVYVSDPDSVKIFDPVTPPDVATGTASAPSATSATLSGTVGPNGLALTDCHFEYVTDAAFLATGFGDLSSGGTTPCSPDAGSIAANFEDHVVTATITGLDPATIYHFRLLAANAQATAKGLDAVIPGIPLVETTGSPTRTATTARLDSRLDPREAATSYHFEYGDQGPCDSNPCTSTPTQSAGSGDTFELVSQQLTGLKANTTYHYRLLADNGIPGGTAHGQDATITTRASDASLTHGHFPGPPGSDRAWEQVNIPDTGGNKVASLSISNSGERAIYSIDGGSPGSTYGGETFGESNDQFAERTPDGWRRRDLYPTRVQAQGNIWQGPWGSTDLTELYAINRDETNSGTADAFRLTPGAPAQHLYGAPFATFDLGNDSLFTASDDGSRVIGVLYGTNDPAYPLEQSQEELYDFSGGSAKLIGLLPGDSLPSCGVHSIYMKSGGGGVPAAQHWLTPDGSHVFFNTYPAGSNCGGRPSLYDRDLLSSTTTLIAPQARFIRSAAGAVFFVTAESLVAGDPAGNDIYSYQIDDGSVRCLTCAIPGGADVRTDPNQNNDFFAIAVSDDGSRVYFASPRRLLAGAASPGIYRLDVASGDLAYVAPVFDAHVSAEPNYGNALSPDGSVFVFRSANPELNALNGQQNGGTAQSYRYDDRDRSLICASCPSDGSLPRDAVSTQIGVNQGANRSPLAGDDDFFFVTKTPLVPADQNNGSDVYEWRDGRLLLVTDGKTESSAPEFAGLSADGRNVFFRQAAALTPDAIDSVDRLYDARVGGGFKFSSAPAPCSLEACQGIASPPPSDATPASLSFSGPGNQADKQVSPKQCGGGKCVKSHPRKRCVKGKVLKHGKCVKKLQRKRAKRTNRNHGGAK
jgi:hypothetical protein